ncbi:MAG: DUF2155 domain-containing protein [Alphaproteobacteria bacterium]
MNKINKLLITTAFCTFCFNAQSAEIEKNTARFQAMNKITGTSSTLEIPVNSQQDYEDFSIVVRNCKTNPPEETPESYAFVDIAETNDEGTTNIYKGWMLSSSPALNPLEHPMYDLWLLECTDSVVEQEDILSSEELDLRDEIESTQENDYYADEKKEVEELFEEKEETINKATGAPESIINIVDSQVEINTLEKKTTEENTPEVKHPLQLPTEAPKIPASTNDNVDVENVILEKVSTQALEEVSTKNEQTNPEAIAVETTETIIEEVSKEVQQPAIVEEVKENTEQQPDVVEEHEASQLIDFSNFNFGE